MTWIYGEKFTRVINPGMVKEYPAQDSPGKVPVYVKIEFADGRLSLTGVVGPRQGGNCIGSCGQIYNELDRPDFKCAPKWDGVMVRHLGNIWEHWHLNDMRAGCEHQRKEKWDERRIDPAKRLNTYGKHFPGQTQDSWNMWAWIPRTEHPQGLLLEPCPTCGYKYGSAWLKEEVPEEVLRWLYALPQVERMPAWV